MLNHIDIGVCNKLREIRQARGANQKDLAEAMDVTYQMVQKIEKCQCNISAGKLQLAADFLEVSILEFYEKIKSVPAQDIYAQKLVKAFMEIPKDAQQALLRVYKAIAAE